MQCLPYQPEQAAEWNVFLAQSRNGTFLFNRDYMDYHADRFQDASVCVKKDEQLIAILPASLDGDTIISHGGLTFGGLVLGNKAGAAEVLEIFTQLRAYWAANGIRKLIYKPVPHIYHTAPSEEDLYALHRLQAKTVRVDVSTTIDQTNRLPVSKMRKRLQGKALKAGVVIKKSEDYAACWEMLTANLADRHGVKPTHTLSEITLLASRCPEIALYMAYLDDKPVAGVVVYAYSQVAHTQYIALTDAARETGALDLLLETLVSEIYSDKPYFNFGISTYDSGRELNAGLCAQKEMFGGRTTMMQWLEMECV
ncbi:MAG: GNAT family N-acetyltransferase [Methylophilus sp.]|uniref:GNAT family N-acetyltransferase n=1 Tax=Methylophilus sp. TaxID=29541 RepID=UPI003F9F4FB3